MISDHTRSRTAPFIYMAPIRGLTDHIFRNTFLHYFDGIDSYMAPFINPQKKSLFKEKHLSDVLPENNQGLNLVPQLLHTTEDDFLSLAAKLEQLGYTHLNWNLGCPAPMVVHKKRGSGFLPYPEEILRFLDNILPHLHAELSIKTRLGFQVNNELASLLPRLNKLPLKEIIIHARLGKQMYKGNTDIETFLSCCDMTQHPVFFNGDIIDEDSYKLIADRHPSIAGIMIGRGAIADPTLPARLKGRQFEKDEHHDLLKKFHDDLFSRYEQRLSGPSHILGRMKQIWQYLCFSFHDTKKIMKKLNKAKRLEEYTKTVEIMFANHFDR